MTQRYFNLALLAGEAVEVEQPLWAEDTRFFLAALAELGWRVEERPHSLGLAPGLPPPRAKLWCGEGGTMLRFLTAALSTIPGEWVLDGTARLRQRPMAPLMAALRRLGAEIESLEEEGFAPLRVTGATLVGGQTPLDAGQSSQFLSALLMAATRARKEVVVRVEALTSTPYLDLTLDLLGSCGVSVERRGEQIFRVQPQPIAAGSWRVEGDYSAAGYPAAAAALTGGRVEICGVEPESKQGDRKFLEVLRAMGARLEWREEGVVVSGSERLAGLDVDLSCMPDQVPTLAAIAPFAAGTTRLRNVPHLRLKESDRLAAMARELRRLGGEVEELEDGLRIEGTWAAAPPPSEEVVVETYGDHRIAMALTLTGLRRPGVIVAQPQVVAKSYPAFWSDLERLLG
ncbi:MAG: 3-phosphoshikimate 1-carboxyvinyltransferase [Thermoanaerobaculia bacterium]